MKYKEIRNLQKHRQMPSTTNLHAIQGKFWLKAENLIGDIK